MRDQRRGKRLDVCSETFDPVAAGTDDATEIGKNNKGIVNFSHVMECWIRLEI